MKHLRILLGIVLVVSIVFSVLLSSTSIAFAESDGESSEVEGSDVTNDENQDETTEDFDLKADWAEMNIKERILLVLGIVGSIMVIISFFLSFSSSEIINVICGVTESIGCIFIGIAVRVGDGKSFGWPWWGCMLWIIWSLIMIGTSLGTRATIRTDADGKEKVIWSGLDGIIIPSLIVLPLVF